MEAGGVLMRYFNKKHRIEWKPNAGIVTEADKAAENLILKKIFRNYPDSSIITEESGEHPGDKDFCWVMDPLDGTTNYAHGFPWFAVSIGLLVKGKPEVGVIYQPVTKELFVAQKGKGSFLNGKRLRVSCCTDPSKALFGTGFYYSKGAKFQEELEIFGRMNETARGVRRPGSAALDLAYVARGIYDGFWERGLSAWDVAAGFLLVEEAGGKVSDYSGKPTTIFEKECVASNGGLHRRMIEVIRP